LLNQVLPHCYCWYRNLMNQECPIFASHAQAIDGALCGIVEYKTSKPQATKPTSQPIPFHPIQSQTRPIPTQPSHAGPSNPLQSSLIPKRHANPHTHTSPTNRDHHRTASTPNRARYTPAPPSSSRPQPAAWQLSRQAPRRASSAVPSPAGAAGAAVRWSWERLPSASRVLAR